MRNIMMNIQYDGSRYKGWQKQNIKGNTVVTIQDKIENVLSKVTGETIQVIGCSRTDSGVHAKNYVANFKIEGNMRIEELLPALRLYLPEDIIVKDLTVVGARFHARLNTVSKTYEYTIDNNTYADVFLRRYAYHIEEKLNVNAMIKGSKALIGTHDFQSYTTLKPKNGKSTIRTINSIDISEEDNIIKIRINGDGFLLNMVRIMVSTLIEVGRGNIPYTEVSSILESKSRAAAPGKAPGKGLCLLKIEY